MGSRRPSPLPRRRVALTARDRTLLGFAAEHRIVLAAQLACLLGCSEAAARRRLGTLRDAGLVTDTRRLTDEPAAWAITRAGQRVIESPFGRPRRLDLAGYRHDVGLGWLAAAAHTGRFGELAQVITERRMRSEDARGARMPAGAVAHPSAAGGPGQPAPRPTARHGIRLGGWGAGARLHYPDLVLVTPAGHRIALELELTPKTPARRERILAAYAVDPSIDAVLYFVDRPGTGQGIARSAARVGATGKLRIQRCAWAEGGSAEPPAPPARNRTRSRPGVRRGSPPGAGVDRSPPGAGSDRSPPGARPDRAPIGAER